MTNPDNQKFNVEVNQDTKARKKLLPNFEFNLLENFKKKELLKKEKKVALLPEFEELSKKSFSEIECHLLVKDLSYFYLFRDYISKSSNFRKKATVKGLTLFKKHLKLVEAVIKEQKEKEKINPEAKNIFSREGRPIDITSTPSYTEELNGFIKQSRVRQGDTVYLKKDFRGYKMSTKGIILDYYILDDCILFQVEWVREYTLDLKKNTTQVQIESEKQSANRFEIESEGESTSQAKSRSERLFIRIEIDLVPLDYLQIYDQAKGGLVDAKRTEQEIETEIKEDDLLIEPNIYEEFELSAKR